MIVGWWCWMGSIVNLVLMNVVVGNGKWNSNLIESNYEIEKQKRISGESIGDLAWLSMACNGIWHTISV